MYPLFDDASWVLLDINKTLPGLLKIGAWYYWIFVNYQLAGMFGSPGIKQCLKRIIIEDFLLNP